MSWVKKEEWRRRANDFMVVVSHHIGPESIDYGIHRWCVYVYVYPRHPLFDKLIFSTGMLSSETSSMPLHRGCSFFRKHIPDNNGVITSVQVGCDYNHEGDWHYSHIGTEEEAAGVFRDADTLFNWMEVYEKAAADNVPDTDGV